MSTPGQIDLPQLTIFGEPEDRFVAAMKIVSAHLHQRFLPICGEASKYSCVLSSLAVRDFLFRVGFRDAVLSPVRTIIRAERGGKELKTVAIGYQDATTVKANHTWAGHMAVCIPSLNYIVDSTLFQAQREAWPFLPGMLAVPLHDAERTRDIGGFKSISGMMFSNPDDEYVFDIIWLDDPKNTAWKNSPDTSKRRREGVVQAMTSAFLKAEERQKAGETHV